MRIIRPGNLERAKKHYTGTCHKCGAVFEADEEEVKFEDDPREQSVYCTCPTCGRAVYVKEKVYRE